MFAVIIALVLIGVGAIIIYSGVTAGQRLRVISDTPTTPVSQLTSGAAEVKGRVTLMGPGVVSPLSRTPCVLFRFEVQEWKQNGRHGHWHTIINDLQDGGLGLDDGSGKVRLQAREAELLLDTDAHAKSGTFNAASPELEATMQAYGRSTKGWIFNKGLKYSETMLQQGDELYALGAVLSAPEGGWELRKGAASPYFIVSDWGEERLLEHFAGSRVWRFVGGGALLVAGLATAVLFTPR